MTNNEIISSLRGLIGKYNLTDEEWQTIEKTIKVLSNSDEDCISRAEAVEINKKYHGKMPNDINHQIWQEIKDLPPVTPKLQMVQNPCVECGCNYCTNDDCENRYIVDIAESEG